jgi:hypothetical protein
MTLILKYLIVPVNDGGGVLGPLLVLAALVLGVQESQLIVLVRDHGARLLGVARNPRCHLDAHAFTERRHDVPELRGGGR